MYNEGFTTQIRNTKATPTQTHHRVSGKTPEVVADSPKVDSPKVDSPKADSVHWNDGDGKMRSMQMALRSPAKDGDGKSSLSATHSQTVMKTGTRFKTEQEIQRASMEAFLKDQAALKPFKHPLERCLPLETMKSKQEEVLPIDALEDFHAFQDMWEDSIECANDIIGSVIQTAGDIVQHTKGKLKAAERKKKADENMKQRDLLKKIKDDAAEAARKIREQHGARAAVLPPLYALDWFQVGGITPAVKLSQMPALQSDSWTKPFVVTAACEELALMVGNAKLQKHLSLYGREYKKSLAKVKAKDATGRDQEKVNDEEVDEACKEVLGSLLPQLDISEVEGGSGFMSAMFSFGYAAHPDHVFVGSTPNCAAQVKVLAVGEVNVLMINLFSLIAASGNQVGPAMETLDYIETIAFWNADKVDAMIKAGVTMYSAVHKQGEMLVVPQGWLVAEMSCAGHKDIYGIRKAFFSSKAKDDEMYEACIKLFEASAKDATRMKSILEKMKED